VDPQQRRRLGRDDGDEGAVAVAIVKRLWSRQWRWLTITCLWIAVAVLAQWGFAAVRPRISAWDRIYMTPDVFKQGIAGDLAAQDWRIQLARFLGPLIFATTFFAAVATIFRDQIARARVRLARGHVVVAGLGDKGSRLAASLDEAGQRVVAVERDPANPNVGPLRRRGVTVLDGDAADGEVLRDANVARADALVAICDADGTNADVLEAARRLLTAAGRPGPPPITGKALTIMTTPTTSTTQPHTASRSETSSAALVVGFCSKTSESVTAMSPSIMFMMPSSRRMMPEKKRQPSAGLISTRPHGRGPADRCAKRS
jgi:voltage-gated potassium channel Kch